MYDAFISYGRVWHDVYADRGLRDRPTPIFSSILKVGIVHEEEVHQATAPDRKPVLVKSWDDGVRLTQQIMKTSAAGMIGAFLEVVITSDLAVSLLNNIALNCL
jgi:hypothetical protein